MQHRWHSQPLRALRAALGALTLAVLAPLAAPGPASAGGAEIGQPAPALVAAGLDGHPFDLAALRGKVVIVNFWASWCWPCRAEMPLLNRFYLEHRAQGLELIGLSVDDAHDRKEVGGSCASSPIPPRSPPAPRRTASDRRSRCR